ncbi:MAG: phosphoribosylanthranilate isomerase [Halioglobus sp.]|nr:phosphoribosylanthranilate isomerase [Halioglobus sp.]MDG2325319.1 phosphoribosylanthranilate isomerase [Halioglobus sp.]
MSPTRIKICGITRPEDALAAASSGADAIGLVFYADSPRAVTVQEAKDIAQVLPPFVTLVSLFVNAPAETISDVLSQVPVGLIQFHGDEDSRFCRGFGRPWIKALRVRDSMNVAKEAAALSGATGVLLDAWQEGVPGGTGRTFDWALANEQLPLPMVLAGGLDEVNVGDAIGGLRPWAVDVSGGVESSPGIKDAEKIQRFVAAVRAADQKTLDM